ncbi:MAG TPA: hypothetical protein DDZ83_08265 [Nitrospinae bacterium]|nr:hypothetical protein [Nitrospinota bacterium]
MPKMTHVGNSPVKKDALAKAVGDTVYGDDLRFPNELVGKVIRPPAVPAKIKKIDPSRALALPGVHCVLTAKDIPGKNAGRYPYYPVLAEDSVCFGGDAVAILAAETHDLAEWAARLVKIDYEPLPGTYAFEHIEGVVLCDWSADKGDVEAGFAQADVVVENTYFAACIDHAFIEPEGGVAWVDERGTVNIRVPTQTIENYQNVAATLGLPASRVRYDCPMLGGAFGGKEHPLLGDFLGLLTMKTGRPVRIAYTREESMGQCSKKHPFLMRYKTGATREGKLTAVEVDIVADAGAYPTNSGGLVLGGMVVSQGPYEVPNSRARALSRRTTPSPRPCAASAPTRSASPTSPRWTRWPSGWGWSRSSSAAAISSKRAGRSCKNSPSRPRPCFPSFLRKPREPSARRPDPTHRKARAPGAGGWAISRISPDTGVPGTRARPTSPSRPTAA